MAMRATLARVPRASTSSGDATAIVQISATELAALLGVHPKTLPRMVRAGTLVLARPARAGRALFVEAHIVAQLRAAPRAAPVRVPGYVWASVVALLPHATPDTLATEIAGALRAAASVGGVGRRRVSVG